MPKVSIIVPCYNQAQFLDEALQSVLDQTYIDWECIIVNDGSTDHTEEVAQRWVSKDSRFVCLKKENGGLSSARNAGLEAVKGEYIQFLDSDDWIANTKLELSINMLQEAFDNNVKIAISNFRRFINKVEEPMLNSGILKDEFFNFDSILYKWDDTFTIPIHCGLFEKTLFQNFKFPEELGAKEDWIMWVSLFYKDCKAVHINEVLALYRINIDGLTHKDMTQDIIKAHNIFRLILSEEEFNKLSEILFVRYINYTSYLKFSLINIQKSNRYRVGNMIKKSLYKLGVLKMSKKILKNVLKVKIFSKYF
ncbi:glycosyltransferase family 2 protein [Flavobacterium franklandianum]|uniref:Glycosyltransferase family 2 protein n=2 Tax=Flavobacterium TaxID=237 RepID=A0A553CK82_9FLAO|nr:glycosyltransferase family 2 protein [Flavobacterium franklandianum]TRX20912.1 glycosyltransferase family 2 protein [Flavobacterium franklandianum]TRX23146.1 glycosyltransferase family 2 protein [Flavobacterium franklandianum]